MSTQEGNWLHAAFESSVEVEGALHRLAQDGVPAADIEVRSSAPLGLDLLPAGAKTVSHVYRMAAFGGLLGGTALFLTVMLTARSYALPTGGMPITPLPPAGIITFEGVAIGAILASVATVLYECRLPRRWRAGPLDHYLAEDCILVTVRCAEEASTAWTSQAIQTARS